MTMTSQSKGLSSTGGDFLTRKSDLTRARKDLPEICTDILIVEDETFDADRLQRDASHHVWLWRRGSPRSKPSAVHWTA